MRKPRYLPPNEAGEKPYVVTCYEWGQTTDRLIYANTVANAKYRAIGRPGPGRYIKAIRRATPADRGQE